MISDCTKSKKEVKRPKLFENQPELLKPADVARLLGISTKTIYDWRYHQKTRNIPDNLFIKFNKLLYIQTAELRHWIILQNSNL